MKAPAMLPAGMSLRKSLLVLFKVRVVMLLLFAAVGGAVVDLFAAVDAAPLEEELAAVGVGVFHRVGI